MNNQQRQQVLEQITSAKHILVTVSSNPTVDELAASIGLTLAINKMDKHATTVFSGVVPSTIEFLQPEKTIETTTDSLRDFIIALDKSKADKLRYKVEDDVVRIFITPYRTTITDKDLEFSQGDFNVDLVIALGVTKRQDLDRAITAHGRILHDAIIVALTEREMVSELGSINWQDNQASSLCEMVASIITELQPQVLDGQMATAFLTGIIAETDRFKNEKTTPLALSLSSQLMTSGANQQLIAEKLEAPEPAPELHSGETQQPNSKVDGELEINHSDTEIDNIHIDDDGNLNLAKLREEEQQQHVPGELSNPEASEAQNDYPIPEPEPSIETEVPRPLSSERLHDTEELPKDVGNDLFNDLASQESTDHEDEPTLKQPESSDSPMMRHQMVIEPPSHPDDPPKSDKPFDPEEAMKAAGVPQQLQVSAPQAPQVAYTSLLPPTQEVQGSGGDSLADLERSVGSPHVSDQSNEQPAQPPELNEARDSVIQAVESQPPVFPTPAEATGSHPISLDPPKVDTGEHKDTEQKDPNAPPPVPPPMMPQFYDEDGNNSNPFRAS
jgi:hypothetical protein